MKALSIKEPYASLILHGYKMIETRSWKAPANMIGKEIIIHASKSNNRIDKEYLTNKWLMTVIGCLHIVDNLNFGKAIAKARLVDCVPVEKIRDDIGWVEYVCGFYDDGRYAWILDDVTPIEPFETKGHLGFWEIDI